MIYIHKGDSTIFADITTFLTFNLKTELDLTGWKAIFKLQSYTKEFDDITAKTFCVNMTQEDTLKLNLGENYGVLALVDADGNMKTISNTIPFLVTLKVVENEPQVIDLTVPKSAGVDINISVGAKYVTSAELSALLETKQDKGDYATNDALAKGLATKQPIGDYPTKQEVNALIASLPKFKIVVGQRPATGEDMTIYLEPKEGTQNDIYNEYLWANNQYELLGTTAVDLTDYVTTSQLNAGLNTKQPIGNYIQESDLSLALLPMTQSEYDALAQKEDSVIYLIKED